MMRKVCPECKSNYFDQDPYVQEITCKKCGLVITAPFAPGLFFPGFLYLRNTKFEIRVTTKNVTKYVRIKIKI